MAARDGSSTTKEDAAYLVADGTPDDQVSAMLKVPVEVLRRWKQESGFRRRIRRFQREQGAAAQLTHPGGIAPCLALRAITLQPLDNQKRTTKDSDTTSASNRGSEPCTIAKTTGGS